MSVAGEPLEGRHGVIAYSAQTVWGTAVTPATAVGICDIEDVEDADVREIQGLGQAGAQFLTLGELREEFNIQNFLPQGEEFLVKCIRASGVLPWLTLAIGYQDDAATPAKWTRQVQDCKVGQLEMTLESGGLFTSSASGVGGLVTELTGVSGIAPILDTTNQPFHWYEAVLTSGGSALEADSFRVSVNHNLRRKHPILGAAPGSGPLLTAPRLWKYLPEGRLQIAGEVATFGKMSTDLQANTQAGVSVVLTLTSKGSSGVITITLTGTKFGQGRLAGQREGELMFRYNFIATGITIA